MGSANIVPININETPKEEEHKDILKELEEKGVKQAKEALTSREPVDKVGEKLVDFMKSGADDFEKRTGRPMTYSEMRSAWG